MSRRRRQRGSAAVELALVLPVMLGVTWLAIDMYNLHQARSHLDQTAHTIASVLGVQRRLDLNGVNALVNGASVMNREFELVIRKVESDRSMAWRPLHRGTRTGICPSLSTGERYTGPLPETQPAEDDETPANLTSMIVVQVCASVDDQQMGTALLAGDTLQVHSISRLQHGTPSLDEALQREVMPQEQP